VNQYTESVWEFNDPGKVSCMLVYRRSSYAFRQCTSNKYIELISDSHVHLEIFVCNEHTFALCLLYYCPFHKHWFWINRGIYELFQEHFRNSKIMWWSVYWSEASERFLCQHVQQPWPLNENSKDMILNLFFEYPVYLYATMLQPGRSRVRVQIRWFF
jgi:hypothetical protein